MTKLDTWIEIWQDDRIRELQHVIDTQHPYQPRPGEADYLTPEQVERLRQPAEEDA